MARKKEKEIFIAPVLHSRSPSFIFKSFPPFFISDTLAGDVFSSSSLVTQRLALFPWISLLLSIKKEENIFFFSLEIPPEDPYFIKSTSHING